MSENNEQNGIVFKFSPEQLKLAEMLANPDITGSKTAIMKKAGVPRTTFYSWLKDSDYSEYIESLICSYTDAELSTAWRSLMALVRKKDISAIKLFFELKGRYRTKSDVNVNLTTEKSKLDDIMEQLYGDNSE